MALSAQQQVRHLYVAESVSGAAASSAVDTDKEVGIASANGLAPAAGVDFKVYSQSEGGSIASPIVKADKVSYAKSVQYVAPTLGVATVATLAAPVAGTLYSVSVTITGYGSLSPEDEYVKKAFYQAVTGDDQEAVVDGLILALNRNFSREVGSNATYNPYFAFSKTGSAASAQLVITERADWTAKYWKVGKKDTLTLPFHVHVTTSIGEAVTAAIVPSSEGIGQGKQIASMEWYLKGERNDFYREAGYPHNFDNTYDSDKAANYNIVEIGYYQEGRDEAKKSLSQITIACKTTGLANNTETNKLVTDLNTILGAGTVAALPIV